MQDELEPIVDDPPTKYDESDDLENTKKTLHERGWYFNMKKGPGVEF